MGITDFVDVHNDHHNDHVEVFFRPSKEAIYQNSYKLLISYKKESVELPFQINDLYFDRELLAG